MDADAKRAVRLNADKREGPKIGKYFAHVFYGWTLIKDHAFTVSYLL